MADINFINISGRFDTSPKDVPQDTDDKRVVFTIAVEGWNGSKKSPTVEYYYVEAKGAKAKYILEHAKQGDSIVLAGKLRTMPCIEHITLIKRPLAYIRLTDCKIFPRKTDNY